MTKRKRSQGSRESKNLPNLPTDIIREIQSILPWKTVVRFSSLSKDWSSIWDCPTRIILDEVDFGVDHEEYSDADKAKRVTFLKYLTKFLEIRQRPSEYDCELDKLFLRMTVEDSRAKTLAKKWIGFALEKKVKSLSLDLKTIYRNHYYLRGIAFCVTTLVDLTISYCEITNCSFELPALKFLFLFVVCIEDDDFKDLIAGCPRIEKLGVKETEKLQTIIVSNPELKFFGVNLPCLDGKIRIESANLESLEFISFSMDLCEVEITSTDTVRQLTLRKAYDQPTLIHLIKKFPQLEKLVIDDCNILSEIEISPKPTVRNLTLCNVSEEDTTWTTFIDQFVLLEKLIIADCKLQILHLSQPNLASLVLKDCMVKYEVQVDSPKFKSLEFKGDVTKFKGIEDLHELEFVMLYFDPVKLSHYWYSWLSEVLKSCARSKHLSLICKTEEVIIFPIFVIDKVPVSDIKHLELEIMSCPNITQELLENLIWILPDLKTLSLTLGSTTKFIKFSEENNKLLAQEVHNRKPDKRVSILKNQNSF
ncbi:hypothetical protein KY289_003059 [Solanum tuberosum]|nr:hypothetical protein KY289_003059 [Solanum tuberosum]